MILGCIFTFMKTEYIFTIITILIGISVAYTGYSQYRLSKEKFKLDMFDKRYGVYKNTQIFLTKIFRDAKLKEEDIYEFRGGTQDSAFLFQEDIPNYLKSIDEKAVKFWEIHQSLDGVPKGEKRSDMLREQTVLLGFLTSQLPELENKFVPYLKFKMWK